jgi:hypothetical protein
VRLSVNYDLWCRQIRIGRKFDQAFHLCRNPILCRRAAQYDAVAKPHNLPPLGRFKLDGAAMRRLAGCEFKSHNCYA